jgi:hypothetical protein
MVSGPLMARKWPEVLASGAADLESSSRSVCCRGSHRESSRRGGSGECGARCGSAKWSGLRLVAVPEVGEDLRSRLSGPGIRPRQWHVATTATQGRHLHVMAHRATARAAHPHRRRAPDTRCRRHPPGSESGAWFRSFLARRNSRRTTFGRWAFPCKERKGRSGDKAESMASCGASASSGI